MACLAARADTDLMARVDPADDSIRRYILRRYAYDPRRRERRHQIVAAFDSEAEFEAHFREAHAQLVQDRAAGTADPDEHYSGVVQDPGYQRLQQNGRLVRKAIARGVNIDTLLDDLELPSNVGIIRAGRDTSSADIRP